MTYTVGQLKQAAYNAGFRNNDIVLAVAVSLAENSARDPKAKHVNSDGSVDIGAWQINSVHNFSGDLTDLQTNANAAYAVYKKQGWTAWVTFKNKAFSPFLKEALITTRDDNDLGSILSHPGKSVTAAVTNAPAAVGEAVPAISTLNGLIAKISSPEFWKRIGLGALAFVLLVIGVVFMLESNKTIRSATAGAAKVAAL